MIKKINITKEFEVERAISGKIYPAGCTLICLSATKGAVDLRYHDHYGEIESRYAVVINNYRYDPFYIFLCIQRQFEQFFEAYHTTINLQFDVLRFLNIEIHDDIEKQKEIASSMRFLQDRIEEEEEFIDEFKGLKKRMLKDMFV